MCVNFYAILAYDPMKALPGNHFYKTCRVVKWNSSVVTDNDEHRDEK